MDTTRLFLVAVVGITVLALALGAPTLTDLTRDDSAGEGEGSPPGDEAEPTGEEPEIGNQEQGDIGDVSGPPWLLVLAGMILLLLLGAALAYGIGPARIIRRAIIMTAVFVVVMVVVTVFGPLLVPDFVEDFADPSTIGFGEQTGLGTDESAGDGSGDGEGTTATSIAVSAGSLFVLVAAGLLGLGLLSRYSTSDRSDVDSEAVHDPAGNEVSLESLGEAAGRALESSTETTASNSVYRAWAEMTGELDVENRQVRTPAEFEEAAIAAGMESEDVSALTDLFRTARYSGEQVTGADEREAKKLLGRIEATYSAVSGRGATDE